MNHGHAARTSPFFTGLLEAKARLLRDRIEAAVNGVVGQDKVREYRSELAVVEAQLARLGRADRT